jgi:hypothetical protein
MTTSSRSERRAKGTVFICFARPSGRDDAIALRDYLNGQKIRAFVDEKDAVVGEQWRHEVQAAHRAARLTVVCVTAHLNGSPYANGEIENAIQWSLQSDRPHQIVPWIRPGMDDKSRWPPGLRTYQGHDGDVPTVAQLIAHRLRHPHAAPPPREAPAASVLKPVTVCVDSAPVAAAEAEGLLLDLLCDREVRRVAADAFGVAEIDVLKEFRGRTATNVVNAFNRAHHLLAGAGQEAARKGLMAVLQRVLPYLLDWSALTARARSSAAACMRVELPLSQLSIAEVVLAGAEGRSTCFRVGGSALVPQHLVMLSKAVGAYRSDPRVVGALAEVQLYRRAGRLLRAVPQLLAGAEEVAAGVGLALPDDLDDLAKQLARLDGRLSAVRASPNADRRATWSIAVENGEDGSLWQVLNDGLEGVTDLRLVRLAGGADGPSDKVIGNLEGQLIEMMERNP